MKCVIPGTNVRVLARAILALGRIGDELYVEPEANKLSFRSVNSARSAYASFTFERSFFSFYKSQAVEGTSCSQNEDLKCKIFMKSCLPVFRSPNTLDKQVETCLLRLEGDGSRLVFEFRCRHGVVKTHHMPVIECETLQVVYTRNETGNRLTAQSRLLADTVLNFQTTQEEVTLAVTPTKTYLQSYSDSTLDPSKVIHTELCLEPGEFDHYVVTADASVTFCLKEFRALLSFAEATALPVVMNFEAAGQPIVFVVSNTPAYEAHFVLATLAPETDSQSTGSLLSVRDTISSKSSKQVRKPSTPAPARKSSTPAPARKSSTPAPATRVSRPVTPAPPSERRRSLDESVPGPSSAKNNITAQSSAALSELIMEDQSASLRLRESDGEDDTVPGTPPPPPNKKARMLFRRCFEPTFDPHTIPGHNIILADDSDGEGDDTTNIRR